MSRITNVLNKYGLWLWHKPHACYVCGIKCEQERISEPSTTHKTSIYLCMKRWKVNQAADETRFSIIFSAVGCDSTILIFFGVSSLWYLPCFFLPFVFHWHSIDCRSLLLNQYTHWMIVWERQKECVCVCLCSCSKTKRSLLALILISMVHVSCKLARFDCRHTFSLFTSLS